MFVFFRVIAASFTPSCLVMYLSEIGRSFPTFYLRHRRAVIGITPALPISTSSIQHQRNDPRNYAPSRHRAHPSQLHLWTPLTSCLTPSHNPLASFDIWSLSCTTERRPIYSRSDWLPQPPSFATFRTAPRHPFHYMTSCLATVSCKAHSRSRCTV